MKNSVFIEGTNAVAISWSPNFDEFLSELKIAPNTFASTILERVFQFYFVESVDVKFDYDRFYSIEYNSLGNFALPHRGGPPVMLVRRFPRSGVHAATSSQ